MDSLSNDRNLRLRPSPRRMLGNEDFNLVDHNPFDELPDKYEEDKDDIDKMYVLRNSKKQS